MAEYINKEEVLERCEALPKLYREAMRLFIKEIPSVNIVRCKECKYEPICNHSVQHTTHEPTSVTIGYKSVEWCSYGERRDDE